MITHTHTNRASGVPEPVRPEPGVVPVADAANPGARVRAALAALGLKSGGAAAKGYGGKGPARRGAGERPGILDYHAAYMSGAWGDQCVLGGPLI